MLTIRNRFFRFIFFACALAAASEVFAQTPPTCAPAPKGLTDWWAADKVSGSTAMDIIDGNPGPMIGGVTVADVSTTIWQRGNAFAFDGSGFINMADSPNLNFGTTGPFSLEGWFNWGGGGDGVQNIVRKSNFPVTAPGAGYWVRILRASSVLEFFTGETVGTDLPVGFVTTPVTPGIWHHFAATRDSSGLMSLYLDGVLRNTTQAADADTTSATPFTLGAWTDRFGVVEHFSGLMNEISAYNRALTPSEVAAIFKAGSAGKCRAGCQVNVQPVLQCAGEDILHLSPPFTSLTPAGCDLAPAPACHWGAEPYAFHPRSDGKTMCTYGCGTTSLSMALLAANVQQIPGGAQLISNDPGHLNDFMTNNASRLRYTDNNDVNWWLTTSDLAAALGKNLQFNSPTLADNPDLFASLGSFGIEPRIGIAPKTTDAVEQPVYSYIDSALCSGSAVIVKVPSPTHRTAFPDDGHFVLVYGNQGDDYLIADPAGKPSNVTHPRNTLLSGYGEFTITGFVTDPADLSALNVSVGENADLLITDGNGNRTGLLSSTGQIVAQIPHSLRATDNIDDDEDNGPANGIGHIVHIYRPGTGNYSVTVTGIALGTYQLGVRGVSVDGSPQSGLLIAGVAGVGSINTFQVQFSSTPGSSSVVVRAATFQSALDDINNSLQLGLIDNQGIANSLSKKIKHAQEATGDSRNNNLNAFINEVNAQAGKHITGVAVQVLLDDADALSVQ